MSELKPIVHVSVQKSNGDPICDFTMRRGSNLWVFLRKHKVAIGSACSGVGICGACAVHIVPTKKQEALNADTASNVYNQYSNTQRTCNENDEEIVSLMTDFEKKSLEKQGIKGENSRLACLCRIYDDVTVTASYW